MRDGFEEEEVIEKGDLGEHDHTRCNDIEKDDDIERSNHVEDNVSWSCQGAVGPVCHGPYKEKHCFVLTNEWIGVGRTSLRELGMISKTIYRKRSALSFIFERANIDEQIKCNTEAKKYKEIE
jgi:hypothetical protein